MLVDKQYAERQGDHQQHGVLRVALEEALGR